MPAPTVHHSPADVIAQLLVDAGQVTEPDSEGQADGEWPVVTNQDLDAVDSHVGINDVEGGSWKVRDSIIGDNVGPLAIQVRVSSNTHRKAWNKACLIYDYLSRTVENEGVTVAADSTNGTAARYYVVECLQSFGDLMALGRDVPTSRRHTVAFNAQAVIR